MNNSYLHICASVLYIIIVCHKLSIYLCCSCLGGINHNKMEVWWLQTNRCLSQNEWSPLIAKFIWHHKCLWTLLALFLSLCPPAFASGSHKRSHSLGEKEIGRSPPSLAPEQPFRDRSSTLSEKPALPVIRDKYKDLTGEVEVRPPHVHKHHFQNNTNRTIRGSYTYSFSSSCVLC